MSLHSTISLEQLGDLVESWSQEFKKGDAVALCGEMGAGKTTFLFNLLQKMGIQDGEAVSSPTFSIHQSYSLKCGTLVHHFDLYRLESVDEFENLDFHDLLQDEHAISFVEWGEKFSELEAVFSKRVNITIQNDNTRHFELISK